MRVLDSSSFKAILWDKDGTLIDNFSAWVEVERALATTLAQRFLATDSARKLYVERVLGGLGISADGRVSAHGLLASGTEQSILDVFYQSLIAMAEKPPSPGAFFDTARSSLKMMLSLHPVRPQSCSGALAALEFFRSKSLHQGLATSDTEARARADLHFLGFDSFLSFWACGDRVPPKPDPWSVREFARFSRLSTEEILVVGDTPTDQKLARAAGSGFVALLCGTGVRQDFEADTLCLENPLQLPVFWEGKITKN